MPVIDAQANSTDRLVQHMDEAVAEVFDQMLTRGCAVMPELSTIAADLSARIRFSGAFEAQCILEFPSPSAHRLTDAILGSAEAVWDDLMVADTVGELCNMIAGGFKMRLGEPQCAAALSLPLLSHGSEHTASDVRAKTMRRVYAFDDSLFLVRMIVFSDRPAA